MNRHPIPAVALTPSDVAAIARLRAEGKPWPVLVEELAIPAELRADIDLLPLFHPDWTNAYSDANRQCELDAFAEAQLVTRRLLKLAETSAARLAARKRAGSRRSPARSVSKDPPPTLVPGHALAFRLARGETRESIAAAYLAGLTGER